MPYMNNLCGINVIIVNFLPGIPKSVTSHVNAKHKNYKTVPCDFCEEKFVSRRDRDKHITNKHIVVKAME